MQDGLPEAKSNEFVPGMPADPDDTPTLRYQVVEGKCFFLSVKPDGSRSSGEQSLEALQAIVGSAPKAGWYSASGKYLGSDPGLSDWLR